MKKYLPIAFLSIAFVLLLLFLYVRKSETFVEDRRIIRSTPTSIEETSLQDWQTYRNEKYGFEFQHPAGLGFNEKINKDLSFILESENKSIDDSLSYMTISFKVGGINDYKNLTVGERSNINIAGTNAQQYLINDEIVSGKIVVIYKDNKYFTIRFDWPNNKEHERVFDQVLSTFKFTNSALQNPDTTSFKTYKNTLYNFEFNYPNDLTEKSDTFVSNDYKTQVYSNEFAEYETPISGIEVSLTVDPDGCSKINPNSIKNDEMFSNVIKSQTNNVPYTSYHREWEGFTSDAVIFTASNLCPTLNFSFGKNYQDKWQPIRDQIISTFKFTK